MNFETYPFEKLNNLLKNINFVPSTSEAIRLINGGGVKIDGKKINEIEVFQRKRHKCPYCSKIAVKRVAFGIFQCKSCGSKFTGKAYFP